MVLQQISKMKKISYFNKIKNILIQTMQESKKITHRIGEGIFK